MQNAPERIVTQRRIIIRRRDYARHGHNIWSEVATAAVKSFAESTPSEKRTIKVSEISNAAVLRDTRATVKGTTRVSEISSTAVLRICALGVGNCDESTRHVEGVPFLKHEAFPRRERRLV